MNRRGELIWCHKPEDFGTAAYGQRRKEAIDEHFAQVLKADDIDWLFDYWLEPSARLRQYLWAHRDAEIETARKLISVLPPEVLFRILRYPVDSYWERYLGWPDLLLYRDDDYFFAEVKSSNDKLSNDQKRWIRDNDDVLRMPFKLVKVHKTDVVELAP
ncbi:VRR-NUC domain-containing protein [Rubinisphaera margarita]|uniref:VRR-NUC domain-containing protein n=1 Tax=Rubinisphaera margarita TaxID=2909586 RepID=UPI0036F19B3E